MDEVINFSFIHPAAFDRLNWSADSGLRNAIPIVNPIVAEFPQMRTTLADSLLNTLKYNLAHKNEDLKLYEIGSVYLPEKLPLEDLPAEKMRLCGVLCGRREQPVWYASRDVLGFFDAKGIVEELLAVLGILNCDFVRNDNPQYHPGKSCAIIHEGDEIGCIGEIHPVVARNYDVAENVIMFEMDIQLLLKKCCANRKFSQLPKQQSVKRDLALVLPVETEAAAIASAISAAAGRFFDGARLFDLYSGDRMAAGRKSLGFSLYFRADDHTLTDEEINREIELIVTALSAQFDVEIRVA